MTDASVMLPMNEMKMSDAKSKLMNSAVKLFAERGFHATHISNIVQAAGVAQGTFYLHYQNKNALFIEAVDLFFNDVLSATLGRYGPETLVSAEQLPTHLYAIWRIIFEHCRERSALTALVLEESQSLGPENRQHIDKHRATIVEALAGYVRLEFEQGHIPPIDPLLAGWVIMGMVERAVHYVVFVAPDASINEVAAELVRLELTGLMGPRNLTP